MATQAVQKKGFITGNSAANQAAARDVATGTPTNAPTNDQNSIQYFQNSGRGSGTFRYIRTFLKFDTSGISGGSSFVLNVGKAASGSTTKVFVVKSNAFTGEDGILAAADFNNLDFSTLYTAAATGTTWAYGSGTNDITLSSGAASDINGNNTFIVALVGTLDYNDAGLEEDGADTHAVGFGGTIQLTFTAAASGYSNTVNFVDNDSLSKINTVATADIAKVITVA